MAQEPLAFRMVVIGFFEVQTIILSLVTLCLQYTSLLHTAVTGEVGRHLKKCQLSEQKREALNKVPFFNEIIWMPDENMTPYILSHKANDMTNILNS